MSGNPVVDMNMELLDINTSTFFCRFCQVQFKDELLRNNHEEKKHRKEIIRRLKSEKLDAEQWITMGYGHLLKKCKNCDFKATQMAQIKKHNEIVHKHELTCKNC